MTQPKKSDLGIRTLSAVVMVAVAGTALWLGGLVWTVFVVAVALGVLWEWRGLVARFETSPAKRGLWNAVGVIYSSVAGYGLIRFHGGAFGGPLLINIVGAVIATDIGAYFFGRTLGGPKIAPRISPSKTWSGLIGGIFGAAIAFNLTFLLFESGVRRRYHPDFDFIASIQNVIASTDWKDNVEQTLIIGGIVAVLAQSGDFFESWMKRRAGVKDSGKLIPGHGGLFDRVDGLLAVSFFASLLLLAMF